MDSTDSNSDITIGLILVDVQQDYLRNLVPLPKDRLIENLSELLITARECSIPIVHSHTLTKPDGSNRMPHQKRQNIWRCVEGTTGSLPPEELVPRKDEKLFHKTFYSAFSNSALHSWLQHLGIDHLIIAGVYTHACVRATILDAYQLGYSVTVPKDGIASGEILHAQVSLEWLAKRACTFTTTSELTWNLRQAYGKVKPQQQTVSHPERGVNYKRKKFPALFSHDKWYSAKNQDFWEQRNPSNWQESLGFVPLGRNTEIETTLKSAIEAETSWQEMSVNERSSCLSAWKNELEKLREEITFLLTFEVGKPLKEARAEVEYGLNLMDETIRRVRLESDEVLNSKLHVRYRPLGPVALITPWNNPFAIPLGKIVPALAYGNPVVWKPALQAPRIATLVAASFKKAGFPVSCFTIVFGDGITAQLLAHHHDIRAISFTGSVSAGRDLAAISARYGKKLQAEMGGNNAVLIGRSADTGRLAKELVPEIYSFSGQRCTSPRRLIVAEEKIEEYITLFKSAIKRLKVGMPGYEDTQAGPLISRAQQNRIKMLIDDSIREGARLLAGGFVPPDLPEGCWYAPTLLVDVKPTAKIFQEESFGPVAILSISPDFKTSLELCNSVPYGLSASLYTKDEKEIRMFLEHTQAAILRINSKQGEFSAEAPFGGWKASGNGWPEHGRWDREFYTKPQTVYKK